MFDVKTDVNRSKLSRAIKTIDKLNLLMGKNKIQFGAMGFDQKWKMKQEYLTKRYKTCRHPCVYEWCLMGKNKIQIVAMEFD